jgi:hypothetical protein
MAAKDDKQEMVHYWSTRCKLLLQDRSNLTPEDLGYVASKVSVMKDVRLQQCVTELIGWGDDERAELETFCAIALELMKDATPSRVREAARRVELRYLLKDKK